RTPAVQGTVPAEHTMVTRSTSKRRKAQVRGRAKARWLRVIGSGLAVLLGLELAVAGFIFLDQPAQSAAGMCPNLLVAPSGQVRDRGLMSCNNLANDKSRTDLIRDSFVRR